DGPTFFDPTAGSVPLDGPAREPAAEIRAHHDGFPDGPEITGLRGGRFTPSPQGPHPEGDAPPPQIPRERQSGTVARTIQGRAPPTFELARRGTAGGTGSASNPRSRRRPSRPSPALLETPGVINLATRVAPSNRRIEFNPCGAIENGESSPAVRRAPRP